MSIESEINRIRSNIGSAYSALASKGAEMPVQRNSGALSDTIRSLPEGGAGYATPEQYGAVGDGVTDDTAAINACLAANPCVVFSGVYQINTIASDPSDGDLQHGVSIPSNRTLLFQKGAKLVCIPNESCHYRAVLIHNAENIMIDGLVIEGDRTNEVIVKLKNEGYSDRGVGLTISGSKNIIVRNAKIYHCLGDGLAVWSSGDAEHEGAADFVISENVTVENCELYGNRRNGMTIGSSKNVKVIGCTLYNNGLNKEYPGIWTSILENEPLLEMIDAQVETIPDLNPRTREGYVAYRNLTLNGNDMTAPGISPRAGVDIEPDYLHNPVDNVTVENCRFYGNGGFDFCNTQGTQSNLSLVNCVSEGGAALNTNKGVSLQRGDISIIGGRYRYISVGHAIAKGVVQGAYINEIYSSVQNRGDILFDGCYIHGLLGVTGESGATIHAASAGAPDKAWVVLKSCVVESCIPNTGYNYGYIVLEDCYVTQPAGVWFDLDHSGHLIAKNTEFHLEGNDSVSALFRVRTAELTNCDFYNADYRSLLISVVDTSENKIWSNNRFHSPLSGFSPKGNALYHNLFNFASTVLSETATGARFGNVWTDKVDLPVYTGGVQ